MLIAFLISLVSVALINYVRAIKGISLPLTVYAAPFPLWIVFFVIGVYLSRRSRDYSLWWIVVGLCVTLLLQIIEARYLCSFNGVGQGIKPSSFVFSLFVILLLFSIKMENSWHTETSWFKRLVARIGEWSFVIYLSHTLVILFVSKFSLYGNAPWLFRWLLIATIDVLAVCCLKQILPAKMRRYVGF